MIMEIELDMGKESMIKYKHLNASCIKIGISLFEAHPNSIEVEKHDIPLDYCIKTPLKLYRTFRSSIIL